MSVCARFAVYPEARLLGSQSNKNTSVGVIWLWLVDHSRFINKLKELTILYLRTWANPSKGGEEMRPHTLRN